MEPRAYDFFAYRCEIQIGAPPERVFAIVGDLARSNEWAGSGQVLSVTQKSDGPVGVGTTYIAQEKIGVRFKSLSRVVGYEPPRFIAWTSRPTGPNVPPHRWAFWLIPESGGTRLVHEVRAARATWPARLMQKLSFVLLGGQERVNQAIREGMEKTLERVKTLAESTR
jgi:uncharacterized protein YndB with AHSA1/START domain